MSIRKSLVCAAIAAGAFSAQAQNLVVNGSFEQVSASTTQNTGTWAIYNSITGWNGTPNIEVRDSIAGNAQQGSNYVELDTNNNSGMFQTIAAGAGWYELSFWYSARMNVAAGSNGLGFTFGSLSGQVLNTTAGAPSGNVWQQYTGLVLLNGPTSLMFYATGKSDSLGGSLDNVTVTAVPEPESYAMMLAGLALMGTIARRRKTKSA